MKKTLYTLSVVLFLSACNKDRNINPDGFCPTQNLITQSEPNHFPDQYIIVIQSGILTPEVLSESDHLGKQHQLKDFILKQLQQTPGAENIDPGFVFTNIFQGFSVTLSPTQWVALNTAPWIKQIEPVKFYSTFADCQSGSFDLISSQVASYGTVKTRSGNGEGKRVWVLDTGVDTDHPDLTVNRTLGRNFVNNTFGLINTNAEDDNGHGTHVSGIIAAKNNSFGTVGVAAGAEVVPIKVLDSAGESSSNSVLLGLDYILSVANAGEVVNMSLGGEASSLFDMAVQALGNKGIYVAMAAGNESQPAENYSPARANGRNLFTVSAVDQNNRFAFYSNFGNPPVDYAEPGSAILSTYLDGKYRYMSGTSMAAPHMAGILLLQGQNFATEGNAIGDPDGSPDRIAVLKIN